MFILAFRFSSDSSQATKRHHALDSLVMGCRPGEQREDDDHEGGVLHIAHATNTLNIPADVALIG